jgi:hypothetical protein
MQCLEVSGAVRHIYMYMSLGGKGLNNLEFAPQKIVKIPNKILTILRPVRLRFLADRQMDGQRANARTDRQMAILIVTVRKFKTHLNLQNT